MRGLGVTGALSFWRRSPRAVEALWDARGMGASSEAIASTLGLPRRSMERYICRCGGLRAQRWASPARMLSYDERLQIKDMLREGRSYRQIASALGRAPSTISREVARGSMEGTRGRYRPARAQQQSWTNRLRPKPLKIPADPVLHAVVQDWLEAKLSPEQIVGRLQREYPNDPRMRVSRETIYRTIYLHARGGLKRELTALTRTGRTIRYPNRRPVSTRGRMRGMVSTWDRPAEALERKVPGHWEGDLIIGKNGASAIGTVVERFSNYLNLVRLEPGQNRVVALREALVPKLVELPESLRRSLTWDQGKEMAQHRQITIESGMKISFADPHAPWQRATNENTNGLLRQYFPKGTDLSIFSQLDLDQVADEMNRRPRKRLQFATPYETLEEHLLQ